MGDDVTSPDPLDGRRLRQAIDRAARRYEPVVIVLCAIVLIARFGPGSGGEAALTPVSDAGPQFGSVAAPPTTVTPPGSSGDAAVGGSARPLPTPTVTTFSGSTSPSTPSPPPSSSTPEVRVGDMSIVALIPAAGALGGLAVGPDGHTLVSVTGDDGVTSIVRLSSSGDVVGTYELTEISGPVADIEARDPNVIHLLGAEPARVVLLNLETGEERVLAELPDVPPCVPVVAETDCDGAVPDRVPRAGGFAFDSRGNLYITDSNQGAIWRIDEGDDEPYQFHVHSDLAGPVGLDGGLGISGIAVDGADNLVYSVERMGDGPGGVFLHEVTVDDEPGTRTTLYMAGEDEQVGDLTLSRSGRVYVVMRSTGQLLVLEADGTEAARLPAEAGALQGPGGLAFSGTGVLVAAKSPTTPDANVIVRVEAGEEGGSPAR